jgi:hypothetical protein
MYLAMASLQEFPSEIVPALKTVRSAANTARSVIRCPKCGTCLVTDPLPPIGAFQNTMLLGTILPIIIYGYKQLLTMIDKETEEAQAAGKMKIFQLEAYGGVLGSNPRICVCPNSYNNTELNPSEWRSIVRALLRVDIYGNEHGCLNLSGSGTGLRGIISELENRQRMRHSRMDELIKTARSKNECFSVMGPAGTPIHTVENGASDWQGPWDERNAFCIQIVGAAKRAVDSLVIA